MQRAAGRLLVAQSGSGAHLLRIDVLPRLDGRLALLDLLQQSRRQFDGGQLARGDARRGFGCREGGQVGSVLRHFRMSPKAVFRRSEEHTSELQSLMRISYAVFCLKKKTKQTYK